MPVVGNKLILTPIWIKVWKINNDAKPHNESFKNSSSLRTQFFIIRNAIYKKIVIIKIDAIDPYSSDIIAII